MPRDSEPLIISESEQNPYAAPLPIAEAVAAPVARAAGGDEMSPELLDELQRVANYRQMRKRLRASGIGSIFFGVIAIAIGVNMLRYSALNLILVAIGVFLLTEGLWLIIRPSPIGVILDGAALMLVGTWNIAVQILNAAAGHHGNGVWPVIGILQIIWGRASLRPLPAFRENAAEKPSPEVIKRIDKIAKDIGKSKMANDPELVELQTSNFFGKQIWKGRLRASFAAFVVVGHNEVIFARPKDVALSEERKARFRKSISCTLRIADRTVKATLSPEAVKRFQEWTRATTS